MYGMHCVCCIEAGIKTLVHIVLCDSSNAIETLVCGPFRLALFHLFYFPISLGLACVCVCVCMCDVGDIDI